MAKQKFTPLTKNQVDYANEAVRRFLADLEEHGVHIVYDGCNGDALLVPADFVNSYAEDGYVVFGNDIAKKIFATDTAKSHPWNGWFCDEATDPDTHKVTRWHIGVNKDWKEPGETGTEVPAGKKYELTRTKLTVDGHALHRIRALRDITDPAYPGWEIKKGELGGFVESEENLSHEGAAWVTDDAKVYGDALVSGNALVCDSARVSDAALVCENAKVYGSAKIYGHAKVYGSAMVYDNAHVGGIAEVFDVAEVYDDASVYDNAQVFGHAEVRDDEEVCDDAQCVVYDGTKLDGSEQVCEKKTAKNISNSGKKYELTDDTVEVDGHTLHRIRALRELTDPRYPNWIIHKDDFGGYIESEENLSHEGSAWVGDDAQVYGNAKVYDDASVCGNALVCDDAQVYGHAEVRGTSQVCDEALVFGNADVCDEELWGTAEVHGDENDEDEPQDSPKDSPDLETRLTTLEGRVDTLAKDMVKTVKEIKDIKKQIAKKPKTPKKTKKTKKSRK